MSEQRPDRGRLRSFLIGGLVGASAGIATARRRRRPAPSTAPGGLRAFEQAPCFREQQEERKR